MGCDIHWILEKVTENNTWIGVHSNFPYIENSLIGRNYEFFGELASVRGESKKEPLGMPEDCSHLSTYLEERWEGDGHSHSFMPLSEFVDIFVKVSLPYLTKHQQEFPIYNMFGFEITPEYVDEYRVVFFFDN